MNYMKPKLVMALGSSGGYRAFLDIMENVDPDMIKNGMIYLVDHVGPTEEEISMYNEKGFDVIGNTVRHREKLRSGTVKFQHDAYETYDEDRRIMVISPNRKGLHFVERKADRKMMGLSYSVKSALDSGYGQDMMTLFLSGAGDDGCGVIGDLRESGSKVIIQEPGTAIIGELLWNALYRSMYSDIPPMVIEPKKISGEINDFLFEKL
ncbi:MAG: hypothetical protein J7K54_03480 [Candidatus Aenigmarchaeota archaeon]|nr:hypothetical protein [Candidatus Aenigmarchaeota archaeon]